MVRLRLGEGKGHRVKGRQLHVACIPENIRTKGVLGSNLIIFFIIGHFPKPSPDAAAHLDSQEMMLSNP